MHTETWKDIIGYEGLYMCSSIGRIKSLNRVVLHGKTGRQVIPERIMKDKDNGNGYKQVMLCKNGFTKILYVHKIIASSFFGESNLQVNHIDHNRSNNLLSNLEYVTRSENQRKRKIVRDLPCGIYKIHQTRFRAKVFISKNTIHLGYFKTLADAQKAIDDYGK